MGTCILRGPNDYFFNRFSEIYSLIIILQFFSGFILSWGLASSKQKARGKSWGTWCTFLPICRRKFLYLAKNYLNIIVFASIQFAITTVLYIYTNTCKRYEQVDRWRDTFLYLMWSGFMHSSCIIGSIWFYLLRRAQTKSCHIFSESALFTRSTMQIDWWHWTTTYIS